MSHCCEPFHVYGVDISAPMNNAFYGAQHADMGLNTLVNGKWWSMDAYPDNAGLRGNTGWNNLDGFTGTQWMVRAAKVPPYYPYPHCEKWPPTSSADPRASEPWSVEIGVGLEIVECFGELGNGTVDDPGPVMLRFIQRPVYSSHVIYEDGEQRYVVYVQHSDWNRATSETEPGLYYNGRPREWIGEARESWGKHVQIDIAAEAVVGTFNMTWLDGDATGTPAEHETTAMRQSWVSGSGFDVTGVGTQANNVIFPWLVNSSVGLITGGASPGGFAAHQQQFGLKYYTTSNYMPATARAETIPDDLHEWDVGRVEYDGYVVFCNGTRNTTLTDRIRTGRNHVGDYAIMLPAVRQDIQTSDDESVRWLPWVIARKYNSGTATWKLVTGRWGNSDLRPGSGIGSWLVASPASGPDDLTHAFADGSLREAEVENVIYEGTDQPEVYCYNRVRGKDYVVFTLLGVPSDANTSSPTADFEPNSPGEPGNLNHGLPAGIVFTVRSEHGGEWRSENDVYYSDPGTWVNHDPTKWAAKANSPQAFQGLVLLECEINVAPTSSGDMEFDWLLDNRATATPEPFSDLLNIAASDGLGNHDTFEVWIDRVPVLSKDGHDFPVDAAAFSTFTPFKLSVDAPSSVMSPGKHKIAFVFQRYTDANARFATFAAVDNVKFYGISASDPEGSPWYYDGVESRPVIHQIRPSRESDATLLSRATSVPHYIALDRDDQIWYGNPHGQVRLKPNNIDKDHEIRFTAMPGEPMPAAPFRDEGHDPDFVADIGDPAPGYGDVCTTGQADHTTPNNDDSSAAFDPPIGAFEILAARNYMQNRGANASIRDASGLPLDLSHDPNGRYRYELTPGPGKGTWAKRAHAWSISYNGETLLPHVEIAFRFGMSVESYPWSIDSITIPPFATNVFDPVFLESGWRFQYLRAAEDIPSGVSDDTCHTDFGNVGDEVLKLVDSPLDWRMDDRSLIISRAYTTATSQMPAYRWLFNTNPDPTGDDEGAWPLATEPYPSARAVIYPIYWHGVGRVILDTRTMNNALVSNVQGNYRCVRHVHSHFDEGMGVDVCDVETHAAGYLMPNTIGNPETNFDAVDCDCDCCEELADFQLQNRQGGFDLPTL